SASRYSPLNLLGDARSLRNCDWRTMSGTKRSIVGSWGKRTALMGASCREARAGVRRVRAFSSSLARDPNDLTFALSPEPHGSLAAVHSASRAQPAPAHLGGAKKKVVGRDY